MKKTLAYSEEERIVWNDLFEMFNQKAPERPMEPTSAEQVRQTQNSSKERTARLISNSNSSWSQQQLPPQSNSMTPQSNSISPQSNPPTPQSNPLTPQSNQLNVNSFSHRQIINSSNQNMLKA